MIELIERNIKIVKAKEAGKTFRELSIEFGLSIQRIQYIIERHKNRRMFKNIKK